MNTLTYIEARIQASAAACAVESNGTDSDIVDCINDAGAEFIEYHGLEWLERVQSVVIFMIEQIGPGVAVSIASTI